MSEYQHCALCSEMQKPETTKTPWPQANGRPVCFDCQEKLAKDQGAPWTDPRIEMKAVNRYRVEQKLQQRGGIMALGASLLFGVGVWRGWWKWEEYASAVAVIASVLLFAVPAIMTINDAAEGKL